MSREGRQKRQPAGAFGKDGHKLAPPAPLAATPTAPVSHTGIPKLPPSAPEPTIATTVVGKKEYDAFFALYAQGLAGNGLEFYPLGFIPGPALLIYGEQPVHATPDVLAPVRQLPTTVASLPQFIRQAMERWAELCNNLGYQPTGWHLGQAKRLLSGRKPDRPLVMGMTQFRYRGGDPEVSFGVVLTPTENGMAVERMYNPARIPDVPDKCMSLPIAVLKDGRGPIQKLIRTWGLMEANFASRYHQDGTPREDHTT